MLKFFRKIRKKLLSENKFSKYLIYAIGEILLVVIGILIAIEINDWNQTVENDKKEKDYLFRFSEDILVDDHIFFVKYTNMADVKFEANILIIDLLNRETDLVEISSFLQESLTNCILKLSPTTNAYDEIKSTIGLSVVKDFKIKSELDWFYSEQIQLMKVIEINGILLHKKLTNQENLVKAYSERTLNDSNSKLAYIKAKKIKQLMKQNQLANKELLNNIIQISEIISINMALVEELQNNNAEMLKELKVILRSYD